MLFVEKSGPRFPENHIGHRYFSSIRFSFFHFSCPIKTVRCLKNFHHIFWTLAFWDHKFLWIPFPFSQLVTSPSSPSSCSFLFLVLLLSHNLRVPSFFFSCTGTSLVCTPAQSIFLVLALIHFILQIRLFKVSVFPLFPSSPHLRLPLLPFPFTLPPLSFTFPPPVQLSRQVSHNSSRLCGCTQYIAKERENLDPGSRLADRGK